MLQGKLVVLGSLFPDGVPHLILQGLNLNLPPTELLLPVFSVLRHLFGDIGELFILLPEHRLPLIPISLNLNSPFLELSQLPDQRHFPDLPHLRLLHHLPNPPIGLPQLPLVLQGQLLVLFGLHEAVREGLQVGTELGFALGAPGEQVFGVR